MRECFGHTPDLRRQLLGPSCKPCSDSVAILVQAMEPPKADFWDTWFTHGRSRPPAQSMGMGTLAHCTCSRRSALPHLHAPTCRVFHEYLHATLHRSLRSLEESASYPHVRQQLIGAVAALGQLLEDDQSALPTSEGWLWTPESPPPGREDDLEQVGTPAPSDGEHTPRVPEVAIHSLRENLDGVSEGTTTGAEWVAPRPADLPEPGSQTRTEADAEHFFSPRHSASAEESLTDPGEEYGHPAEDSQSEDLPPPAPPGEFEDTTREAATTPPSNLSGGPTEAVASVRFKACPLPRPPAAQSHGDSTSHPIPAPSTPTGRRDRPRAQEPGAEDNTSETYWNDMAAAADTFGTVPFAQILQELTPSGDTGQTNAPIAAAAPGRRVAPKRNVAVRAAAKGFEMPEQYKKVRL